MPDPESYGTTPIDKDAFLNAYLQGSETYKKKPLKVKPKEGEQLYGVGEGVGGHNIPQGTTPSLADDMIDAQLDLRNQQYQSFLKKREAQNLKTNEFLKTNYEKIDPKFVETKKIDPVKVAEVYANWAVNNERQNEESAEKAKDDYGWFTTPMHLFNAIIGGAYRGMAIADEGVAYLFDVQAHMRFLDRVFSGPRFMGYRQRDYQKADKNRDIALAEWNKLTPAQKEYTFKYNPDKVPSSDIKDYISESTPWYEDKDGFFAGSIAVGEYLTKNLVAINVLDSKYVNDDVGNWATKIIETNKERVTEKFLPTAYSEGGFDSGAWWNALSGAIESPVGFGAPGGMISGKVSALQKATRASEKMTLISELTKGVIKNKLSNKEAQIVNMIVSGAISNRLEGMVMGVESYQNTKQKLQSLVDEGKITEDDMHRFAGQAADDEEVWNTMLMATNIIELGGIYKGKGILNNVLPEKGFRARVKGELKDLGKFSFENKAIQGGTEYVEETFQQTQQDEAQYRALKAAGADITSYDPSLLGRAIDSFLKPDTQMQGIMGFAGGGIQRIIANTMSGRYSKDAKYREEQERRYQQAAIDATKKYFEDNTESFAEFMKMSEIAEDSGNKITEEMLKKHHFASLVAKNFKAGTTDQLERSINGFANTDLSEEEIAKRGWDKDYKQKAQEQLKQLQDMKKSYLRMSKYENSEDMFLNRINNDILTETVRKVHEEKSKKSIERMNHMTQTVSTFVPDFEVKYKVNEETGLVEPSFNHDDYEEEFKTMTPKEKQIALHQMRQAQKFLENDEKYQILSKELSDLEESTEIGFKAVEENNDSFSTMKSALYQNAYLKTNKMMKDYVEVIKENIEKEEQIEQANKNTERIENNIRTHRGLRPSVVQKEEEIEIVSEEIDKQQYVNKTVLEEEQELEDKKNRQLEYENSQIQHWEEVLKVQPANSTAPGMLNVIRKNIEEINKEYEKSLKELRSKNKLQSQTEQVKEKPSNISTIKGVNRSDGQVMRLVIEDYPDGSKRSYMEENGKPPKDEYIKNYPAGTTDEQVVADHEDFLKDEEIVYDSTPTVTEPLTQDDVNELSQLEAEREVINNQSYNDTQDELIKNEESNKELVGEPIEEENPDAAWNRVAHSHRESVIEDGKRKEVSNVYNPSEVITLNYEKLKPGTKVTLSVVDNADSITITDPRTLGTNNETPITFGEYRKFLAATYGENSAEYKQKYQEAIPIEAKTADGQHAFYIHQTGWINEKHVKTKDGSVEQEEDKTKSRALRQKVVEGNTVNATISDYQDGVYFRNVNPETGKKEHERTSDMMPDENLIIAVAKDNELYNSDGEKVTSEVSDNVKNRGGLKDGLIYAVVKTNNNTYGAIPLRQNRFGNPEGTNIGERTAQYVYDTIERVLTIGFTAQADLTADDKSFIKTLFENTNGYINLFRSNPNQKVDIAKYLQLFLYQTQLNGAKDIQEYFRSGAGQRNKSNRFVVGSTEGKIIFGIKFTKAEDGIIRSREDIPKFMAFLTGQKNNIDVYFNAQKEHLKSNTAIPIFVKQSDGTYKANIKNYKDIVKENTNTNIKGQNIGTTEEPFYSYTLNPIITFETQDDQEVKETRPSAEEVKKEDKVVQEVAKEPQQKELEADNMDEMDYYMPIVNSEAQKKVAESTGEFFVEGLTAGEQTEIRRYIVYTIVNATFDSKSRRVDRKKIFEKIKQEFVDKREKLQKDIDSGVASTEDEIARTNKFIVKMDNILNGWKTIEDTAISALQTIGSIDIEAAKNTNSPEQEKAKDTINSSIETEDGGELTPEVATTKENANWDDVSAFTIDSKNTSSRHIKEFMSGLQDRSRSKDGKRWETKKTFWGAIRPIGFDEAYDLVQRLLSDQGSDRSIESYMKVLKDNANTFPYLRQVVAKLKSRSTENSLRNEFFKVMTKHYVNMRFYKITSDKDGRFLSKPFDDNSNSIFRGIKSQWFNQLLMNDSIVSGLDEHGNNVLMFNKDIYTEMNDVFKRLEKKAKQQDAIDKGKLAQKDVKPELLFNKEDYEDTLKIFGSFGITLSDKAWEAMLNGKYKIGKSIEPIPFYKLFIHAKSPVKTLLNYAREGIIKTDDDIFNKQSIIELAKFEEKHTKNLYSNSFISNNKMIFSFSNNKFLVDRFFELKGDVDKLSVLATLPYTKDSLWLKKLCKTDENGDIIIDPVTKKITINTDSNFYETFSYWTASLEPLKTSNRSRENHEMHKLTELEHEVFKMHGIQKFATATSSKKRNISLTFPTSSDKVTTMCFDTEAVDLSLDPDSNITDETVDMLYQNIVLQEIRSILNFNGVLNNTTGISGYDDGGGSLFYNFPSLNTEIPGLFTMDEKGNRIMNPNILDNSEESKAMRAAIKEEIKTSTQRLIKEKMEIWNELGIGVSDKESKFRYMNFAFVNEKYNTKDKIKHAASDMVIQHLVANANFMQLFVGCPAEFFKKAKDDTGKKLDMSDANIPAHMKEWQTNVGKRLAGDIAPRETQFTKADGSIKYLFVDDPEGPSFNYDNIEANFKKRFGEKEGAKMAKKYKGITITDGQEFTTVKEHALLLHKSGKLTDKEYNSIIKKIDGGKGGYYTLNDELLHKVLQPVKPVYVANYVHTDKGIEVRYYVKSSSFPLLPELTRGMGLDNLRLAMEKAGVDRIAFKSAVKSGSTSTKLNLFDKDGNVLSEKERDASVDKLFEKMTAKVEGTENYMHIQDLPRTGMGIQQDVPYKEKAEINKVTQASKNLFTNILDVTGFVHPKTKQEVTGRELQKHYNERYGKLYESYHKALANEIDYEEIEGGYTFNQEKLRTLLIREATSRSWPLSEVAAISHPDFFKALAFTSFAERYEALMSAIVSNKVIKSKLPGMSSVLGTEAGFKNKNLTNEQFKKLIAHKKGLVVTENFDIATGLKPAGVREDGKWHPAQAIVPWKFIDANSPDHKIIDIKSFLDENNMLDLSKVDKSVLEIVGMRIPSQGLNSSSLIEIVGFTTGDAGDLFIATKDFITQMGSDFDIDKLYSYITPITVKDNKIVRFSDTVDEKALESRMAELEKAIANKKQQTRDIDSTITIDDVAKDIEEYKKELKTLRQQYIKVVQTDIIDVHKAVFGNPNSEVQDAITMPLTNWILEEEAKKLDDIKRSKISDKYDVISPLSDEYQKTKFINATAGKSGVAIFSLDNIFNSLCQYAGDMVIYDDIKTATKLNVRFGNKVSHGSLSESRGLSGDGVYNGEYKSTIIQGYQSVSVDNEKLQVLYKLNINNYTFNVIKILNQLGFGEEVVYFINQPIILDYIKELKKLRGQFDKFTPNQEMVARQKVIAKYSKDYEELGGNKNTDYHADGGIELLKSMIVNEDKIIDYKDVPSTDMLESVEDYQHTQCALLDKFIKLNNKGHELGFVESTSNIDSSGIGKNIPEILITGNNVERVLDGNTNVANAHKIFGEIDEKGDFHATTINGYAYEQGLKLARNLWSGLFKYETESYKQTLTQVKAFSSSRAESVEAQADLMKEVWEAQRAYLFASGALWNFPQGNSVQQARHKLLFDNYTAKLTVDAQGVENTAVVQEKSNHKSLASIIIEIKTLPIGNNAYLQKLTATLPWKPGIPANAKHNMTLESNSPAIVKFNASSKEAIGEHEVYQAFLDLIINDRYILNKDKSRYIVNGEDYKTSQLAADLIVYAYLTGAKQEAIQFLKYVPPSFLHSIGIFQRLNDKSIVDFNSGEHFGYNTETPNKPSYLTRQIFQHNPGMAPSINKENIKTQTIDPSSTTVGQLNSFSISKEIGSDSKLRLKDGSPVPFISIRNPNAASKYNLYEFVGLDDKKNFQYKQIDTLSVFGMNEFIFGVSNVRSLIPTNRAFIKADTARATIGTPNVSNPSEQTVETGDSRTTARLKYQFEASEGQRAKDKIELILTTIARNGNNNLYKSLATDLLNAIDTLPKDIKLAEGKMSSYNEETNTITINMEEYSDVNEFERVFMHEILHAFTANALRALEGDRSKLDPEKRKSLENMEKLFQTYRDFFRNHTDIDTKIRFEIFETKYKIIKKYTDKKISIKEAINECKLIENAISRKYNITDNRYHTIQDNASDVTGLYSSEDRVKFYAAINVREFVSEIMTNQDVIDQAAQIEYKEADKPAKKITSKFKEFVHGIVKAFTKRNVSEAAIDEILSFITPTTRIIEKTERPNDWNTNTLFNDPIDEANSKEPIEQNFFNGYRPNSDTSKVHNFRPEILAKYGQNVSTFTLVKAGVRTRSTRTAGWFNQYKPQVGDYFWQINKKNPTDKVLTRITDVYTKANSKFKDNWNKEGWLDSNFEYVKDYYGAIEFEVVDFDKNKEYTKVDEEPLDFGTPQQSTNLKYYEGNIKPEPNTIFVFGSNPEGRHGAGAAKIARTQFGAIYGRGEGLQGNAYALPTKDLRVTKNSGFRSISPEQITESIQKLYEVAKQNPDKQFKIAYRNTIEKSLNGYTGIEMIDMFNSAAYDEKLGKNGEVVEFFDIPSNIIFSKEWVDTGRIQTNVEKEPVEFKTPEETNREESTNNDSGGSYLEGPGLDFLPIGTPTPHLKFFNQHKKAIARYSGNKNVTFKEFMDILNDEPDVEAFFHVITRC